MTIINNENKCILSFNTHQDFTLVECYTAVPLCMGWLEGAHTLVVYTNKPKVAG